METGKSNVSFTEKPTLDRDAVKDIYETYYKKVYNYIGYRINNKSDIEELLSSVFEKVIFKYYTYRHDVSSSEAWIIGIAKNTVIDYYRAIKRHTFVPIDTIPKLVADGNQPEEAVVINENNAELIKALDVLKGRERNVVSMKFATDLKNCEIAKIIGISESNVGTIVNRSMKKLRKELERKV